MKRPGIIVASLLIGATLLWLMEWNRESKYRYRGRTVRSWILEGDPFSAEREKIEALAKFGSNAVPEAVRLLNATNYSIADWTFLKILPKLSDPVQERVVKMYPLVDLYTQRLEATASLGMIGPEARAAIPSLMRALYDGNSELSFVAANALGKIGPEAVPPLLDGLKTSGDIHNRNMILTALGAIGHDAGAAVPTVAAELYDPMCDTEAKFTLEKIGTAALPSLFSMFTNDLPLERAKAVNALSFAAPHDPKVFAALVTATRDVDPTVRQQAAQSLGRLAPENKSVVPPLMALLGDDELPVRIEAAKAIGHAGINGAPAVPQLIQWLSETNLTVQEQACLALAEIGRPAKSGMEAMTPLMQSSDPAVRRAASMSLAALKQFP